MQADYINHMGSDLTVVNAARVSFAKEHSEFQENDHGLIRYLANHNHWTPFSHAMITMRETVPIFVARQRFKHMVGFAYNEESRRYVDNDPDIFFPDGWRKRAENKKQGSLDETFAYDEHSIIQEQYQEAVIACLNAYDAMLEIGVAPEQARMILPQSMMTSYYVTGSLAAWARAYKLRIDPHAQKEIQDLAKQWDKIIAPFFPVSWEALVD